MTTKEAEKEQPPCEKAEPQEEHKWLAKLVGTIGGGAIRKAVRTEGDGLKAHCEAITRG